ncbi:hypothetical protein WMY93_009962 [Mugilogobius chulae]|uniref:Uncharacterized protein n=1 Tax=Mugilogobius chulae TaxID=88201 RepID=A0AAW0PID3_9GOBI
MRESVHEPTKASQMEVLCVGSIVSGSRRPLLVRHGHLPGTLPEKPPVRRSVLALLQRPVRWPDRCEADRGREEAEEGPSPGQIRADCQSLEERERREEQVRKNEEREGERRRVRERRGRNEEGEEPMREKRKERGGGKVRKGKKREVTPGRRERDERGREEERGRAVAGEIELTSTPGEREKNR